MGELLLWSQERHCYKRKKYFRSMRMESYSRAVWKNTVKFLLWENLLFVVDILENELNYILQITKVQKKRVHLWGFFFLLFVCIDNLKYTDPLRIWNFEAGIHIPLIQIWRQKDTLFIWATTSARSLWKDNKEAFALCLLTLDLLVSPFLHLYWSILLMIIWARHQSMSITEYH